MIILMRGQFIIVIVLAAVTIILMTTVAVPNIVMAALLQNTNSSSVTYVGDAKIVNVTFVDENTYTAKVIPSA